MFIIKITTKFASLTYEFTSSNENKLINYLGTSISHKIHDAKNLFTDGTKRPFYSKSKIEIFQDYNLWYSFDITPFNNEIVTFARIAWELRNKLPTQFAALFNIPAQVSCEQYTKKLHWFYVEKWVSKKVKQENYLKKIDKKPKLKGEKWVNIISVPMND